jgi:hypothetical protein
MAGLVLLQRFIERGVFFLSKKAQNVTIGELFIKISTPASWLTTDLEHEVEWLELWICGEGAPGRHRYDWEGTDEMLRFLGEKVELVRICANGKTTTHWVMRDLIKRRDRSKGTVQ